MHMYFYLFLYGTQIWKTEWSYKEATNVINEIFFFFFYILLQFFNIRILFWEHRNSSPITCSPMKMKFHMCIMYLAFMNCAAYFCVYILNYNVTSNLKY